MSAPVLVNRVHQGRQAARARSNHRDALGRRAAERAHQKAAARERARQQEEEERQRAEAARESQRQQERQREQERQRGQEEQERRRNSSPGKLSVDQALEILGLKAGATEQQIQAAYNRLMKRVHPDVGGSNFFAKQLNEARDLLLGRKR